MVARAELVPVWMKGRAKDALTLASVESNLPVGEIVRRCVVATLGDCVDPSEIALRVIDLPASGITRD